MFGKLALEGLDLYRDGGSMSVEFLDRKKVLNVLFFPVYRPHKEGASKRLFLDPIIKKYVSSRIVSPITGISRTEITSIEIPCSWGKAKKIIRKLKPQLATLDSEYKWVFIAMEDIAYSELHELHELEHSKYSTENFRRKYINQNVQQKSNLPFNMGLGGKSMNPVWVEFPDIPWGSIGWRMGTGEDYMVAWSSWYSDLSEEEKLSFKDQWPEPDLWQGFYDCIEHGTTPPWVAKRTEELKAEAIPPAETEVEITSPKRIQGLMRYYFKSPPIGIRARDEDFDSLYCDPTGFVWGAQVLPEGGVIIIRYSGYLIGEGNLEVKQPIS